MMSEKQLKTRTLYTKPIRTSHVTEKRHIDGTYNRQRMLNNSLKHRMKEKKTIKIKYCLNIRKDVTKQIKNWMPCV